MYGYSAPVPVPAPGGMYAVPPAQVAGYGSPQVLVATHDPRVSQMMPPTTSLHPYQQQQQQQQPVVHLPAPTHHAHAQPPPQYMLQQMQQQQQQHMLQHQQHVLDGQLQLAGGSYRDVLRVRHDVALLMNSVPSLRPHALSMMPGSAPLLVISGTLPIAYKGSQYNIPIQLIITETYPAAPPVCKVTPTETMIVKGNHKHVDTGGICYLPYLAAWRPDSSLVALAHELKAVFAADPPVRAKPAKQQSSPALSAPAAVAYHPSPPASGGFTAGSSPAAFPILPAYGQQFTPSTSTPPAPHSSGHTSSTSTQAQKHARERLLSKVGKRYDDLQQIVGLEAERKRLKEELSAVEKMTSEVKKSVRQSEKSLQDIDTFTNPTNPKDLLIMNLKAEDASLEDAMYSIMRALTDEKVDSATFLKQTRQLSRDQFMVRARLQKVKSS